MYFSRVLMSRSSTLKYSKNICVVTYRGCNMKCKMLILAILSCVIDVMRHAVQVPKNENVCRECEKIVTFRLCHPKVALNEKKVSKESIR